jgi:MFS family permease
MVSGTVSPIVSEIAFLDESTSLVKILAATVVGLFIGFIFPVIMEASKRMHRGYCLYNGGVAGGFIATFFVGIFYALGIDVIPENFWDTEHTALLAFFAYLLGTALVIYGIVRDRPVDAFKKYRLLLKESDVTDNDYLAKYGSTCYINIGILCIVSTSLMLFLNIPINGPVLGGILTVTGFAAAGKHLRNTVPVLLGSTIGAHFNIISVYAPGNSLAILFSTGLAPITGKHGRICGFIAGFFHVSISIIVGNLNGGMNLYNNGFAGGFVAATIIPIIVFLKEIKNPPPQSL